MSIKGFLCHITLLFVVYTAESFCGIKEVKEYVILILFNVAETILKFVIGFVENSQEKWPRNYV